MATSIQWIAAILFGLAIVHTFSTKFFEHLAHRQPAHAGLWHLLGEVEVVFGFWALVLVVAIFAMEGKESAVAYVRSRNFTEPVFVFAIMVVAGTRPILEVAMAAVRLLAKAIPLRGSIGFYFVVISIGPLLGSFITEPAAMTLSALILSRRIFEHQVSNRLKYVTLGVLFVNISIGGTLTPFAAPPVLMVAEKWQWDIAFMLSTFGWKAAIAVFINALGATVLFRGELMALEPTENQGKLISVPLPLVLLHFAFLVGLVFFAHYPKIVFGLMLFFLGIAHAYEHYQDRLILRESLLVAFFLAGLVVLGGQQQWWLQPLLMSMNSDQVFVGATLLTAFTDNAALTYLGSLVSGLSDEFKYALVAGAVSGGGLTVIANAPNPAGIAILRNHFDEGAISPAGLLLAALFPTLIAMMVFRFL
jgi:hypothetical protein